MTVKMPMPAYWGTRAPRSTVSFANGAQTSPQVTALWDTGATWSIVSADILTGPLEIAADWIRAQPTERMAGFGAGTRVGFRVRLDLRINIAGASSPFVLDQLPFVVTFSKPTHDAEVLLGQDGFFQRIVYWQRAGAANPHFGFRRMPS